MKKASDCRIDDDWIKKKKIELVHKNIDSIGNFTAAFARVEKLYLSYNLIQKLDGIESFPHLTSLSLSFNHIADLEEFIKVRNPKRLTHLKVFSNPFLKHPNHRRLLTVIFPNLETLDDFKVNTYLRLAFDEWYLKLSKKLLLFLQLLDIDTKILTDVINKADIANGLGKRGSSTTNDFDVPVSKVNIPNMIKNAYCYGSEANQDVMRPNLTVEELLDRFSWFSRFVSTIK